MSRRPIASGNSDRVLASGNDERVAAAIGNRGPRSPGLRSTFTVLAAGVTVLAACGGGKRDKPSAPPIGKVLSALLDGASQATAPWRCAAGDVPALPDEEFKTGERAWKLTSHLLARDGDRDHEIVIGVVADAGGAAPQTVAALGRLRGALDTAKPDLVLTLGGMGATADELQATLGTLADRAAWPLVALPGDLEPMTAHLAAIATLRTRGDVILDGRSVRWIELGGAVVATVPGAGAVERLVAGSEGCAWQADDVVKVASALTARSGVRIVASAEAPREIIDGEAGGELALVPSKALPIDVALHGPLTPAPTPARAGSREGAGIGLSPGTADATTRLPHAHRPSAGVLVIRGGAWSWRPIVDAKATDR